MSPVGRRYRGPRDKTSRRVRQVHLVPEVRGCLRYSGATGTGVRWVRRVRWARWARWVRWVRQVHRVRQELSSRVERESAGAGEGEDQRAEQIQGGEFDRVALGAFGRYGHDEVDSDDAGRPAGHRPGMSRSAPSDSASTDTTAKTTGIGTPMPATTLMKPQCSPWTRWFQARRGRGHPCRAISGTAYPTRWRSTARSIHEDDDDDGTLARERARYLIAEKSVGSRNTDSTFEIKRPSFSDSALAFTHSGSALNAAQALVAASRLGCAMM